MLGMRIRPATIDDARALAAVHVASWQEAYRGLLPDDYLDQLEPGHRLAMWEQFLAATQWPRQGTLVAETGTGDVVGFASVCPTRDDDAVGPPTGELTGIYVDPARWGTGAGRALMTGAVDRLREAGFAQATLWVLRDNTRARRFYELAGWTPDGTEKDAVVAGVPVTEVRYRRDL
jgi:ribosomal protein S18 acetylase RimI-like enzyme